MRKVAYFSRTESQKSIIFVNTFLFFAFIPAFRLLPWATVTVAAAAGTAVIDPLLFCACPAVAISHATQVACRPTDVHRCVACPFTARPRVEVHVVAAVAVVVAIELYSCNKITTAPPAPIRRFVGQPFLLLPAEKQAEFFFLFFGGRSSIHQERMT